MRFSGMFWLQGALQAPSHLEFAVGNSGSVAHYRRAESIGRGKLSISNRIRTASTVSALLAIAALGWGQDSYRDHAGSGVLVSAVNWLQGTLLGTVATLAAVIAVAAVGFMMLTGGINWHGVSVADACAGMPAGPKLSGIGCD